MSVRLAIVADDLTGALDTSVPFVAAGWETDVAADWRSGEAMLGGRAEIVAINTASRHLPPQEAADRMRLIAGWLRASRPALVMKKIDSRLKGPIGAEIEALASGLGLESVVLAPAIPDQGRFTRDGCVVGTGLATPLPIAAVVGPIGRPAEIRDVASDADLDRIAAGLDGGSPRLAVGARGLGAALARRMGRGRARGAEDFRPSRETLFAIGSRDPVTAAQVEDLSMRFGVPVVEAPDGLVPDLPRPTLPLVLRCIGSAVEDARIAERFAAGVARVMAAGRPLVLVASGGDTMLAVLDRLGVGLVRPLGEAAPGAAWFRINVVDRATGAMETLSCVSKSGGFGAVHLLSTLLETTRGERAAV